VSSNITSAASEAHVRSKARSQTANMAECLTRQRCENFYTVNFTFLNKNIGNILNN